MTHDEARGFAEDWAAAWNELAVERVLSHFDENVSFTSPTARAVMGVATVSGKQALREYWTTALARIEWMASPPQSSRVIGLAPRSAIR